MRRNLLLLHFGLADRALNLLFGRQSWSLLTVVICFD
jgi:hypothetical protein